VNMPDTEALSPMKRAIIEIRDLKARVAEAERRAHEPVAVVGFGLRLPGGANDAASFWNLMWDGVDAIREVPADRWNAEAMFDADPDVAGKMNTRWGGFLDDIDQFDASFFGISPREAESLDPQQRLLLEVTWEALESAGIPPDSLFGSNTGVFLGIANSDYMRMLLADREQIDTYTTTGNASSVAAGRLSYVLGAQGPAIALDTACSSSLVAVHLAMQSLRKGESDVALAGGVNLILTPELTINFSRARMMAPDGRCKTFDAAADGYVRSEGCAMLVLKRLRDAQADGDRILAVIRGSAVNQDGRSGGITAPNGPSQEQVIAAALADAGVAARDVSYVEAHGTGTYLGDPIEIGALGAVLCHDRSPDHPLLLGSVKTNIGHTEAAAGVAGLIKLVLMLRHQAIPPHLNLHQLNPHIATEGFSIDVPTARTPWPGQPGGRIGGVSSFGLSGTNAHVVVGEAPVASTALATDTREIGTVSPARSTNVLTLSAKSRPALVALAERYGRHLAEHPQISLADISFSANTGRAHLAQRLAVVAGDVEAARRQLAAFARDELAVEDTETFVSTSGAHGAATRDVVFLFTGHGSHYAGMGHQLYADEPVFRSAIERCDEALRGRLDHRLDEILFGSRGLLDQMMYAQPALFALQFALTELWASWGVRPSIVAGHSAGEYVAAVVAGVLSLDDGLRIIAARGRHGRVVRRRGNCRWCDRRSRSRTQHRGGERSVHDRHQRPAWSGSFGHRGARSRRRRDASPRRVHRCTLAARRADARGVWSRGGRCAVAPTTTRSRLEHDRQVRGRRAHQS
jgi:acyl transferase domain-containing protein